MTTRALVTGAAGFIGSHLALRLARDGVSVRVLDDVSTGRETNIALLEAAGIELIRGSVRDPDACATAASGVDAVYHLGAMGSVPRSVADPRGTFAINVEGTQNVLLAARDAGARRVVFASSSSIYGDDPVLPRREDRPPHPCSPYAAQKLAGEGLCRGFFKSYGLETVALRFFNVYGPRQDPGATYAAVIPLWARAVLRGERPVVHGDGLQTRDFTYVDNVVEACLAAARSEQAPGLVLNVGGGGRITLLDLLAAIGEAAGKPVEGPDHTPEREGDVRHSQADVAAARDALGELPWIDLGEGLARTVAWHREQLALEDRRDPA